MYKENSNVKFWHLIYVQSHFYFQSYQFKHSPSLAQLQPSSFTLTTLCI